MTAKKKPKRTNSPSPAYARRPQGGAPLSRATYMLPAEQIEEIRAEAGATHLSQGQIVEQAWESYKMLEGLAPEMLAASEAEGLTPAQLVQKMWTSYQKGKPVS